MEMASFELEMSSRQTFNSVLSPHERCIRGDNNNNNNNVRNIHVAFEKNLNVFVRDHLENVSVSGVGLDDSTKAVQECSSNKSSVSDHRLTKTEERRHEVSSLPSLESDMDPSVHSPGQLDRHPSRKELMVASSLVQIWEARTTQQPPSSSQSQSQIDSRPSSSGSNVLDNSESLSEESAKESELIQPMEEGNNEEEEEEEKMECDSQFVFVPPPPDSGEKEREGVRVMDIIRKLSNDSETATNNDNGSSNDDVSKEVQTTEVRCFPQVACTPRIRGRQAFEDLLVRMIRDREKELATLLECHSVSKFTHRGRIQSILRIRCYERCIAIQDRHRSRCPAAGSDLNRSPRGSGVMNLLREKYKISSENIETGSPSSSVSSRGRLLEKDPHKIAEKKVLQEIMEKIDLKEVISPVEVAKKAVLSETAENKNGPKKSAGQTVQKETAGGRGEKQETKEKTVVKESLEKREMKDKTVTKECLEGRGRKEEMKEKTVVKECFERREMKEKAIAKESLEGRGKTQEMKEKTVVQESLERREMKEKAVAKESLEGRGKKQEMKEKTVAKESLERREMKEKAVAKESLEGRGEKRDLTKEKAIVKESVEVNASIGIAEKVNLWKSDEKTNKRKGIEKGKSETVNKGNTERVEKKDVLEEATRRIINVVSAERSITTSKEAIVQSEFADEVRRKKTEDCVSAETNSKETQGNTNPKEVTKQADSCLRKPASEEKILQEKTTKRDLKKPVEKESREGRGERRETEESVEENSLVGIAEKVNLWNSKEKKNRINAIEKAKGKTEAKASTETSEVLQEASRRIINVETAERNITSSKEMVEKVHGNAKMVDKSETARCESAEKGRRQKDGQFYSVEDKSKEIIEVKNMNPQEVIIAEESASHGSRGRAKEIYSTQCGEEKSILQVAEAKFSIEIDGDNSQETIIEEDSASEGSKERAKEKSSSQQQEAVSMCEETKKVEHEEKGEDVKEKAIEFVNNWDENEMEEEDEEYGDYDNYNGDYTYDWFNDISRPRSYWEDLRKERYLEVLNTEKKDICNLIQSRTVSNFLTSDLRQKIDNLMISRVQNHLGIQISTNEEEEEWIDDKCSSRNQEDNDETEEEPEKTNLEDASDGCSHSSVRSSPLMMSWSFRDSDIDKVHEPTTSLSVPQPSLPTNQSSQEMQTISDLREQMELLQREVLELRNTVKSCIDMQLNFQKFVTQDLSRSGSSGEQQVETRRDPLKRKCCICLEMPVDSLLYRCGHMCTCLKCAHELQWSSKKCPICMAPIVDVVRAFLDS